MGKCQEKLEGVGGGTVPLLPREDSSGLAVGPFCERTLKKTTGKVVLPMEPGMALSLLCECVTLPRVFSAKNQAVDYPGSYVEMIFLHP